MPKTKEQVAAYNKEYFARPEVIARAKIRNAERRLKRAEYKKTEQGKLAERRYRLGERSKLLQKAFRLKSLYGITLERYEELLEEQDWKCAICLSSPDIGLHVDHCHTTNKVRGLLCGSCNRGLGMFKDQPALLTKAIGYLDGVH